MSRRITASVFAVAAIFVALLAPQLAFAKDEAKPKVTSIIDYNLLRAPANYDGYPVGYKHTANQVMKITDKLPAVLKEQKRFKNSTRSAFLKGIRDWQISYYSYDHKREIVQVRVRDADLKVTEVWTGVQVPWTMARGYDGAFGHKANNLKIWLPQCILFLLPFLTIGLKNLWRRKVIYLDLLMLLSLSFSWMFFTQANIKWSVNFEYPMFFYVLARALWIGFKGEGKQELFKTWMPKSLLVVMILFAIGFRVGLNVTDSSVIDVGYASVVGADRFVDWKKVYGNFPKDVERGDTYGPVTYYAYVPFEQAMPWKGRWDKLPAAKGAAVAFDILTIFMLFLVGRRLRGPTAGLLMAYCWCFYPFTLLTLCSNTNDVLVGLMLLVALFAVASPAKRGIGMALASLSKLAPLGLIPLFATARSKDEQRSAFRVTLKFTLAFTIAALILLAPMFVHSGPHLIYDRIFGYQASRDAPFTFWGYYDGLHLAKLQHIFQICVVLFAALLAFVPRRKSPIQVAALAAAVLILLQMSVQYWLHVYVVWFIPMVFVFMLARFGEPVQKRAKAELQHGW